MKAIYLSFYKVCRLPSVQCMSNYFIVPLFVFHKDIIFNLFSTNYKLQQVRFLLEFEMPCHRTIRYFKAFVLQTEARDNLDDFHFRF